MNKSDPGRQYIDPRLLALMDDSEEREGLDIRHLRKGDVVSLHTRNTIYTMEVVNPEQGQVLVNSNGERISQLMEGRVLGTTLTGTGTMVKIYTVILGLRLCLFVEGIGELILSSTQSVLVNGTQILPMDKSKKAN